jgi:ATP-dependent RNA helicase RhlE
MTHVINYELPNVPETYVHRIGRTGRAGASGIAFSFCDNDETAELRDIHKMLGKNIPLEENHPYHTTFTGFNRTPQPQKRQGGQGRSNNNRGGNNNGHQQKKRFSSERPRSFGSRTH